jgi:hypothetical protein
MHSERASNTQFPHQTHHTDQLSVGLRNSLQSVLATQHQSQNHNVKQSKSRAPICLTSIVSTTTTAINFAQRASNYQQLTNYHLLRLIFLTPLLT